MKPISFEHYLISIQIYGVYFQIHLYHISLQINNENQRTKNTRFFSYSVLSIRKFDLNCSNKAVTISPVITWFVFICKMYRTRIPSRPRYVVRKSVISLSSSFETANDVRDGTCSGGGVAGVGGDCSSADDVVLFSLGSCTAPTGRLSWSRTRDRWTRSKLCFIVRLANDDRRLWCGWPPWREP